jgi:hypothetical protein
LTDKDGNKTLEFMDFLRGYFDPAVQKLFEKNSNLRDLSEFGRLM